MKKTNIVLYLNIIALTGTLLMLVMLILPYASANSDYREYLTKNPDKMYIEEIGMNNSEALDISLVEFVKIYSETAKQDLYKGVSIAFIVITAVYSVFSILALLMALLKKPIAIIIFNLLSLTAFKIIQFDLKDRGVVPSNSYNLGIVNYLVYIIGATIIISAIWFFIEKRKINKNMKSELAQK